MPRSVAPALLRARRCTALVLALGLSAQAAAQHPVAVGARPAHARLAAADVVAVATVEQVDDGRIWLRDARALYGEPGPRFQVKRSPARPPPLAEGDRALLLLRGARPPYVLVDGPDETIRLADPAAEARWVEAFEGWLRVRERPAAWPALYADWIERGPETLRDLAVDSLGDAKAPFQPLPAGFAARLGDEAWDTARPLPVRRAAAAVARRTAPGATRLVAGFVRASGAPDADLSVAAVALAALLGGPESDAAFLRGLGHADAEVRRAVLRALEGGGPAPAPAVRERVADLARGDPESWLRAEAERVLAALPAPAAPAP